VTSNAVLEKLKRVKFDPRVGKHVLFVESKLSR
jgi:ribosomal protein L33